MCKFCLRKQYDYTGKWESEMTLPQFVAKYTPLDGDKFIPRIIIEACQLFEFRCYESWGAAIKVTIEGVTYGPAENLNHLDSQIQREIGDLGQIPKQGTP